MSKLGTYLRGHGMTYATFARQIGKTKSTVSRIVAGKVNVDRETALAIYHATAGAITPNDLFGFEDNRLSATPASSQNLGRGTAEFKENCA